MAGLSGIVKKISDLVTGTPADDDCFVFGKSDLKKITLAKLKDALGITSINSALDDRRTYCIDSGYTPRAEFNMPAGTCALVCTEYGLHYVVSLTNNIMIVPMFLSEDVTEDDRPIIVPYDEQRLIAIRRSVNTDENVRVLVITPFSTITKR